jgi:CBS domain-containing protein
VYDYVPGKAAWMAAGLPFEGENGPGTRAGAVTDAGVATCGLADTVADVARRLGDAALCVVVHDGLVMGLLEGDGFDGDRTRPAAEAMKPGPSTFRPSVPKEELAAYLDDHDLDRTLVTTLDGRLVGLVRRADLG